MVWIKVDYFYSLLYLALIMVWIKVDYFYSALGQVFTHMSILLNFYGSLGNKQIRPIYLISPSGG